MNDQPHVHEVRVRDNGWYWSVNYGDQTAYPDKPRIFRWRAQAKLSRVIRRLIRKHDRASQRAGRLAGPAADVITASIPNLQTGRWGSEQLK